VCCQLTFVPACRCQIIKAPLNDLKTRNSLQNGFLQKNQIHMQAVPPVFLCLTVGLQARSQFASTWRSCGRPTRSRISVIFLAPTEKAQLASKLHFLLRVSQAAVKNLDFFVKTRPSQCTQISTYFSSAFSKFSLNSQIPYCCIMPTVRFPSRNQLCFWTFYLVSSLTLTEGRTGIALLENFRSSKFSVFSVLIINIEPLTTYPATSSLPISLSLRY
jgi:hypothetical protein